MSNLAKIKRINLRLAAMEKEIIDLRLEMQGKGEGETVIGLHDPHAGASGLGRPENIFIPHEMPTCDGLTGIFFVHEIEVVFQEDHE